MKMGVDFKPTANVRVCSDDFPDKCFVGSDQRRKLVEGSIPELFTRMKCMYCGCEKFAFNENTFDK
ncbi:hypothetical protein ALC62_08909 [Cyphomyrmex costatus]|uniref:Uncharacterized protein n=1 Tax=Cyphomyrmex costatus TaxID=456900 RepID=A0A151IGX5_9HYME|nr:hypothetical protein ALC62_08909 [Cyphomyrmex costatus]